MKAVRWTGVMVLVVIVYTLATDAIGWMFGEDDGTLVRRIAGSVAVSYVGVKITDWIMGD